MATLEKIKEAKTGTYANTLLDDAKTAADFRILDVSARKIFIRWKDGSDQYVTDKQLENLKKVHTCACDF